MNCELFQLKELEVEPIQIREVLRCVLHTIIFHRALGMIKPQDIECSHFDIIYVKCSDSHIENEVERKIEHFCKWVEKHSPPKAQISLSFYEKRNKQSSWFGNKPENTYWEEWVIPITILFDFHNNYNYDEYNINKCSNEDKCLETLLQETIMNIIQIVNEKKYHMPCNLHLNNSLLFEISTPSLSESVFKMDALKRMLQSTPHLV